MVLLVVAVGTAGAMRPSIPKLPPVEGYNGCFDKKGALIRDLEAHVDAGKPVFSQLDGKRKLAYPLSYNKTEYGRRPKYLYHCTKKNAAENMVRERVIYESDDSNGDARLGDGVYMTTLPVDWADPKVVAANNYGYKNSRNFENWNKVNAYVRVTFDKLVDQDWVEIIPKIDWQSNFCVPVPQGVLYLTEKIDAEIWFHSMKRQEGELPELFWSAKGGLTPWAKMTKRKHTKYRPGMKWVYDRGWVVVK